VEFLGGQAYGELTLQVDLIGMRNLSAAGTLHRLR
jgi:hypothetical protein